MDIYYTATLNLYQYILNRHWNGSVIVGPDPIGKFQWRVTRFVRSYLPWLPRDDRYIYLQGQAYWILSNLALFDITEDHRYLVVAERCADYIVESQPPDGAWRHPPIRGRKGFISTVEGVWAGLGLIAAYKAIGKASYIGSALEWYNFQINQIGFQNVENGLAANYYAHSKHVVPNVTTMLLWLVAELYKLTNDSQSLIYIDKMIRFIEQNQLDSGELPYVLHSRTHFMCFQYNAFQFLDLANLYGLLGEEKVRKILSRMANYLSSGVTDLGSCSYNCYKKNPEVNYWTAAIAAALYTAHKLGLGNYLAVSENSYERVLSRQNSDGSFYFSDKNYRFLSDRRSYPRPLAMILDFLIMRGGDRDLIS